MSNAISAPTSSSSSPLVFNWLRFLLYFLPFVVFFSSLTASYLSSFLQRDFDCSQPFLLVWFSTSCLTIFLIPTLLAIFCIQKRRQKQQEKQQHRSAKRGERPATVEHNQTLSCIHSSSRQRDGVASDEIQQNLVNPTFSPSRELPSSALGTPSVIPSTSFTFSSWLLVHSSLLSPTASGPMAMSFTRFSVCVAFFRRCLPFSLLWFLANYLFSAALLLTDVSSAVSVEQSATFFIFLFSSFLLQEKVTILKTIAVLTCIGGGIVIAIGDAQASNDDQSSDGASNDDFPHAWVGDVLCVGSALSAAVYMVFFTRILRTGVQDKSNASDVLDSPNNRAFHAIAQSAATFTNGMDENSPLNDVAGNSEVDEAERQPVTTVPLNDGNVDSSLATAALYPASTLIFSCIWLICLGFIVFCLYWPLLFIFHAAGIEPYSCSSMSAILLLFAQAFASACFNFSLALALSFFSPTFVRLVSICSVPASFVVSKYILRTVDGYNALEIVGAVAVVSGFVIFTVSDLLLERRVQRTNAGIQEDDGVFMKWLCCYWQRKDKEEQAEAVEERRSVEIERTEEFNT